MVQPKLRKKTFFSLLVHSKVQTRQPVLLFYLLGKLSKMAPRISFFQAPILLIPRTGVPMSGGRKSFRIGNDWMRIGEKGKERGGRGRYLFQVGGGEERRKRSGYEKQRDWF